MTDTKVLTIVTLMAMTTAAIATATTTEPNADGNDSSRSLVAANTSNKDLTGRTQHNWTGISESAVIVVVAVVFAVFSILVVLAVLVIVVLLVVVVALVVTVVNIVQKTLPFTP